MSDQELDAAIARFETLDEARTAADAAMPRRKHDRPRPQYVGAYGAWTVMVGNIVMLADGTMYDFQRRATVRP